MYTFHGLSSVLVLPIVSKQGEVDGKYAALLLGAKLWRLFFHCLFLTHVGHASNTLCTLISVEGSDQFNYSNKISLINKINQRNWSVLTELKNDE